MATSRQKRRILQEMCRWCLKLSIFCPMEVPNMVQYWGVQQSNWWWQMLQWQAHSHRLMDKKIMMRRNSKFPHKKCQRKMIMWWDSFNWWVVNLDKMRTIRLHLYLWNVKWLRKLTIKMFLKIHRGQVMELVWIVLLRWVNFKIIINFSKILLPNLAQLIEIWLLLLMAIIRSGQNKILNMIQKLKLIPPKILY